MTDQFAIHRKRAMACMQLLFPHCEVTEAEGLNEGANCGFNVEFGGSRAGFAFEMNQPWLVTSAADLLRQIGDAAHRYARRSRGKVQPYAHGVDPSEPWPEPQLANHPPSDNRTVVVNGDDFRCVLVKRSDGKWLEAHNGEPLSEKCIVTHWRELSAYERATL